MPIDIENSYLNRLTDDYLTTSGWIQSVRRGQAVDSQGFVPWFTYSATKYLTKIVQDDSRVFEFGAGNSTLWWASRASEVVSVEHDPTWADQLINRNLPNVVLNVRTMGEPVSFAHSEIFIKEFYPLNLAPKISGDPTRNYRAGLLDNEFHSYAAVLLDYPKGYFNIIVVDGMARVLTAWLASRQLAENGIIVFDNSDRKEYEEAYQFLEQQGFVRIDFCSMGPLNTYEWCTSIFVKSLRPLKANKS